MCFINSEEMVSHLTNKYREKRDPGYLFKNISPELLTEERIEDQRRKFVTIDGSSFFKVAVFTPNSKSFKATPYL